MNVPTSGTTCVLDEVGQERISQDQQWGYIHDRSLSPLQLLSILTEEVGEVAHAINEDDGENYREELIQGTSLTERLFELCRQSGRW